MIQNHLSQLAEQMAKKFGDKTAFCRREQKTDKWSEISWNTFHNDVKIIAKAFVEIGLDEKQHVAQCSNNKVENLIVDFALFDNLSSVAPLYATSTADQMEFIINDAQIPVIFVGDQRQYNNAFQVLKRSDVLKKIIVFDHDVQIEQGEHSMYYADFYQIGVKSSKDEIIRERKSKVSDKDLAWLLYTSGTTGNPKGVMIPHYSLIEIVRIHCLRFPNLTEADSTVAFLPLSHVFERAWTYLCMHIGIKNYLNLHPLDIQETVAEVRPTLMCSVPRFWEKVYAVVRETLDSYTPFMLGIVVWAIATGEKHNIDYLRLEKKPGLWLRTKYFIADKLIFSKVKHRIGIENGNMFPVAGAKLADELTIFFRSIGVPIVYGYGLTESTATVTCFEMTKYEIGTIGSIMPDVQVKIGEDNEILLKGKTITPGYYNNPEANKAGFTEDGWFRTGDAGILKDNKIYLIERLKDLFKTSNGKYIAPQEIETRLIQDKYIEQVAVIADGRNFVTAIVVPSIPALEAYANKRHLSYQTKEELIKLPEIYKLIEEKIAERQKGMANFELIKKFALIPKGFSMESGELTNTLKMRRAVIMQKYQLMIDSMYENRRKPPVLT
ncbi:MAG: long-chain fatty acid--CoA ligase [Prevotellaceae bacterium]|jgi:long-chain acyl-CoA synthetase|nr:long-chain fatty acid--CoA ligase [Prevotellaceae bacterium]